MVLNSHVCLAWPCVALCGLVLFGLVNTQDELVTVQYIIAEIDKMLQ